MKYRNWIIAVFTILALLSGYYATQLKFSYSFDQFFPKGDPDLEFYKKFVKDFESDDNFLLFAIENQPTVFDSAFLAGFHAFGLEVRKLPFIKNVQSLTTLKIPVKTPFGYSLIPVIHLDTPERFTTDKQNIFSDDRFVYNLIDSSGSSMVVAKTLHSDNLENLMFVTGLKNPGLFPANVTFKRSLVHFI
ncbi:MAG: hypothetical protein IPO92_01840 [Saprospiraceae bacterium]|nr:hypothetical protein [Saprospiraceae bacterium]